MTFAVQAGTVLIEERPSIAQVLGLDSVPYLGNWKIIKGLDSLELDRKIHAAGWNFFFMAADIKVMFFGRLGAAKIQKALLRILEKVKPQHFNSLEVTGIVAKSFLGVPYVTVSAHSRHMQQGCFLDGDEARRTSWNNAEWAQG